MNAQTVSTDPETVACEVCLKEIPRTEATVPEAEDYVVHFCGLDCYELWKSRRSEQAAAESNTSV
jgi:hypothetical protein